MRYAGGGVGHYPITIEDVPQDASTVKVEGAEELGDLRTGDEGISEQDGSNGFASGDEGAAFSGDESEGAGEDDSGDDEDIEDIEEDAEGEFLPVDDEDYE